jgi:predicted ArsR family transcriptional regulator
MHRIREHLDALAATGQVQDESLSTVVTHLLGLPRQDREDRQLGAVITSAANIARDLLALLEEIKGSGAKGKLAGSLLASVRAVRKEKLVQHLHKRLLSTQAELSVPRALDGV